MKFLGYFSIRQKLMFVFILWIIIYIGFGIFAITQMGEVNNLLREIYNRPVMLSNEAIEAKGNFYKASRLANDIIAMGNSENKEWLEEQINEVSQSIEKNINSITVQAQNIDIINQLNKTKNLYKQLHENWLRIIELVNSGKIDEATELSIGNNEDIIEEIEKNFENIRIYQRIISAELMHKADDIESTQRKVLIISVIITSLSSFILFLMIISSILKPVNTLQRAMRNSLNTGTLTELKLEGSNELVEMSRHYNILSRKLQDIFWTKDNLYAITQQLSGHISLKEIAERAIVFLARAVDAGNGIFYIYDDVGGNFQLYETYAFTRKNTSTDTFELGEGIIGQVGIDKKPILLSNIKTDEELIKCGAMPQAPLNIYAFPLLYDNLLYGVVELSSFEPFTQLKQDFLTECAKIISVNMHSAIQNDKVKELLNIAEEARGEALRNAEDLIQANGILEEQQRMLQQQAEELQQTNAELEEQQQILQQQSEELQQTNTQLEEQQQLMEEQAKLLDTQNKDIERSRVQLYNRSKDLERANKYKSEFIANISHELRTPLNSIILLSKTMLRDEMNMLNTETLKKVDIIHSSGNELLRLIDDILDLSKIEAGKVSLNLTCFRSGELAQRLRVFFDHIAVEKKLGFVIEDHVNSTIIGDIDRISQILRNFLSNAFKFTIKGSVKLKIEYVEENDDVLAISVIDTGIGIDKSQQDIIFEEFTQGDGSISRKYGGTGLGLSISKKLCDLMGGYITVESSLGNGSKFSLYLPKLANSAEYTGIESKFQAESDIKKEENLDCDEKFQVSGKKILVVSNKEDMLGVIGEIGRKKGFKIVVTQDKDEALRLLNSSNFDGVLMELMLPGISGIEALKEIKSTAEDRDIPVHILSSQSMEEIINAKKLDRELERYMSGILSGKLSKNMLVVDRDMGHWEMIKKNLEHQSVKFCFVNTKREAIKELTGGVYNLVISESKLEDGSGLDLCKYVREKGLNTYAIIYTDTKLSIEQEREIKKYAESVIVKTPPFNERFLEEVRLFLNKSVRKDQSRNQLVPIHMEESMLSLENKIIMIVDDDLRNIFALAAALEKYGADIIDAENGKIALEKLKGQKADLVLMDIMMPEMDGYETIQAIRSEETLKDMPIIALTAKTLKEDRQKCIAAGANDYISKPVDYELLIRMIKAWVSK